MKPENEETIAKAAQIIIDKEEAEKIQIYNEKHETAFKNSFAVGFTCIITGILCILFKQDILIAVGICFIVIGIVFLSLMFYIDKKQSIGIIKFFTIIIVICFLIPNIFGIVEKIYNYTLYPIIDWFQRMYNLLS